MIGVLLNANALGVRRQPDLRERLRRVLGDDGVVIETRAPDEVPSAIARLRALGCDPVGVCGGDGTNLSTVTGFVAGEGAASVPRLALLRGGTVNTVARNVGVRGRPEEVLARIVGRARSGAPLDEREVDAITVNGRTGFLFAAAMGARFLEAYYGQGKGTAQRPGPARPGVPRALLLGARTAASSLVDGPWARWLFAPTPVTLVADGERLAIERVRVLVASAVADVGIGMRLMWRAGSERGRFHVVATEISTTRMALQLDRVLAGRPLAGERHLAHVDRMASDLRVRFRGPQPFTLDGELFAAEEIAVTSGPRLRLVTA